jgi:hypothetical protein
MSTYSPSLRIELITTGTQAGTWGNTTNTNLGGLIEAIKELDGELQSIKQQLKGD